MKLQRFIFALVFSLPCWFQINHAQDDTAAAKWGTNYENALAKAKADGKNMMLVFTAADWVKICQVFDRDILHQPDFVNPISEKFELVRLEFPRDDKQPVNQKVQNDLLKRAYRVSGFPFVVVTDTEGRPFGINGYQPVKPADYAKVMLTMVESKNFRDQKFAEAEAATDPQEKAMLLAEGIPHLPGNLMGRYYGEKMKTVIENDPENKSQAVPEFKRVLADVEYASQMESLRKDVQWAKMVKLTDDYIAAQKLEGVERQRALFNKFGVQHQQKDVQGAITTLIEISKVDPESEPGKQAASMLEKIRAQKLQEDLLK